MKILEFQNKKGQSPFRLWLKGLSKTTQAQIQARLARFETGNLGDVKSVGGGVFEARFMFGPGYRIYFGQLGDALVILLTAGDKSSQQNDIKIAKKLWAIYLEENK